MASTWNSNNIQTARFGEKKGYLSKAVMLADANATFNQLAWPYDLTGQYLVSVTVKNGVAPTDNINLVLVENNDSGGIDLLYGTGNNAIKANGTVTCRPVNNNAYMPQPIYGPLGVLISGQNNANASVTITMRTVPMT